MPAAAFAALVKQLRDVDAQIRRWTRLRPAEAEDESDDDEDGNEARLEPQQGLAIDMSLVVCHTNKYAIGW